MDNPNPEARAMEKLLRGPIPFETERYPETVAAIRLAAEEMPQDDPVRALLLAEADEKASVKVSGELWPLLYPDHVRTQARIAEALEIMEQEGTPPEVKKRALRGWVARVMTQACFRAHGSAGKAMVFTLDEIGAIDFGCIQNIHGAYVNRFVLMESDVPKGSAPLS
jgi:hypothetical protein